MQGEGKKRNKRIVIVLGRWDVLARHCLLGRIEVELLCIVVEAAA
jgi:hypothetical protein